MSKITFILGLCASGKSYLANKLCEDNKAFLIDEGFTPATGDLFKWQYSQVVKKLVEDKDCVVTEIMLCSEQVRDLVESMLKNDVPDLEIDYICIENNLEQANSNVKWRAKKGEKEVGIHIDINNAISKEYTCPFGATIVSTYIPTVDK